MALEKAENALVVKTFSYPTTAGGNGPDDEGTRPLPGVTVRLTRDAVPIPPQTTGPDGEARFENLDEGDYEIVRMPAGDLPNGFQQPPEEGVFRNGRPQNFTEKIRIDEGGEVVAQVGITPELATVEGSVRAVDDLNHVVPNVTVDNIRIEARNGGLLVEFGITGTAGTTTGAFELDIDRPGLIEIIPAPSFTDGGRTFVPKPGSASRFVTVPPGGKVENFVIDYQAARAEITVGAQFLDSSNGQPQRRRLDGITFQIFKLGENQPLFELTTALQTAGVFADLAADTYRVVALASPAGNGQRLQLTRPAAGEISLQLDDGQRVDLSEEFVFEPAKGSVLGSVVVARDDRPVPEVAVVLSSQQQPRVVRRAITDGDGEYQIDGLVPGSYRVALEQRVVTAFGRRWEQESQAGQTDAGRTVEVRARATTFVPEFRLVEEEHLISGRVFGPGGVGASYVTVQVYEDSGLNRQVIANVLTDQEGYYQFRAPTAGTFFVSVLQQNGVAQQLTPVTVNSSTTAPPLFTSTQPTGGTGGGVGGGGGTPQDPPTPAPTDLTDFPFLTEEVDLGGRGGTPPSGGGYGAGAVGQTVERELREVLGWRPRAGDAKGFLAALQQAFTVKEVAGHTEVSWKPRSYSVEIQADLGAITGAQASLYARAKNTLDQVVPLLDGLKPLRVDFDPENVSAVTAIVRSQITELVGELGMDGGPRVQRVDQLFDFLLGVPVRDNAGRPDRTRQRDPDGVAGNLGVLRDRLGLDRNRINTIDEEQDFTNFLVVLDHVAGLAESWDAQRVFFVRDGGAEPFLGTQLVLVSRDLEVIAESVHEVEFAMDSVFLGPAERQTLELRFPVDTTRPLVSGSPPMFVSELLSWIERFATEEGRQLIDAGGREGVVAFRPTIQLLQALVEAARVAPAGLQDVSRMPAAYQRQRVQRALAELAQQLKNAADRVALIRAPVDPNKGLSAPSPVPQPPAQSQEPAAAWPRPHRRLPHVPPGDHLAGKVRIG